MDIKVNRTYLIEIGSTKVQMSKFDMIKLRDLLNQELGEDNTHLTFSRGIDYYTTNKKEKWNFPTNPWYSVQD